jgi:hypothetical protein
MRTRGLRTRNTYVLAAEFVFNGIGPVLFALELHVYIVGTNRDLSLVEPLSLMT